MFQHSSRLYLRPYEERDFGFLVQLLSDPKMVQFIGDGKSRDCEGDLRFYNRIKEIEQRDPRLGLKLLVRKEDHIPIGHAGLVPQTIDGVKELEIGYWIAVSYWGQGYASEAAMLLKTLGMEGLKQNRLISLIQEGNTASQKVAMKLGMFIDKTVERSGKRVNVYALTKI